MKPFHRRAENCFYINRLRVRARGLIVLVESGGRLDFFAFARRKNEKKKNDVDRRRPWGLANTR